jgi:hypothetical protein
MSEQICPTLDLVEGLQNITLNPPPPLGATATEVRCKELIQLLEREGVTTDMTWFIRHMKDMAQIPRRTDVIVKSKNYQISCFDPWLNIEELDPYVSDSTGKDGIRRIEVYHNQMITQLVILPH